jgi:hypothetical protein
MCPSKTRVVRITFMSGTCLKSLLTTTARDAPLSYRTLGKTKKYFDECKNTLLYWLLNNVLYFLYSLFHSVIAIFAIIGF